MLCSILYYVTPYRENSSTYFPSIQFFQLYIQTYINFNVFKVSDISRIDRETFRSNLHLHLHPRVFSTNRCNAIGVGGEKKASRVSRRVFYSRFKLCDGIHYGNNRSRISPAINSGYGISRVFTRIPATLRQQHRAVGKQRPQPY